MKQKQFMASTRIDKHNTVITLQALESMVELLKKHRKPAVLVQHDRTVPPMGSVVSAQVRRWGQGGGVRWGQVRS